MDNPSAFPRAELRDSDGCGLREGADGMTLRDWFAGQALAASGLDAAHRTGWSEAEMREQALQAARVFYVVADAMLDARTNGGQSNG